jgi:hypothetical protein
MNADLPGYEDKLKFNRDAWKRILEAAEIPWVSAFGYFQILIDFWLEKAYSLFVPHDISKS